MFVPTFTLIKMLSDAAVSELAKVNNVSEKDVSRGIELKNENVCAQFGKLIAVGLATLEAIHNGRTPDEAAAYITEEIKAVAAESARWSSRPFSTLK